MTLPRGQVQVYTGNGKGETTAALGLALRGSGRKGQAGRAGVVSKNNLRG